MAIFAFLMIGASLAFISLVIWSAVRVTQLGDMPGRVDTLQQELDRVQNRLAYLERRAANVPADAPKGEHWQTAPPPVPAPMPVPSAAVAPPPTVQPHNPAPAPIPAPAPAAAAQAPAPHYPGVREVHIPPRRPAQMSAPLGHPQALPPVPVPAPPAPRAVQPPAQAPVSAIDLVMQNAARIQELASAPAHPQQATAPMNARTPEMFATQPAQRSVSLEERLGRNWLNKVGIVALVTGLSLLMGYQLRSLGPIGKSIMGFVLSAAILVTGLLLERRNRYRIFARAAIGGGWALLFFVSFALYHLPAMQVLQSEAADLVLMLGVATGMVVHSLRYRSQVVTTLAFLLGFLTVAISHVTLFSLVAGAILAAGLVVVAFRERWFVLALGGLAAVYLTHGLWLYRLIPDGASPGHPFDQFIPSAALLLFYWLIFRLFYIFRVPQNDNDRVYSTLNVLLNSAGLLALLKFQSSHPEWAFRGLLVLGAAEMLLAFVARRRHHQAFTVLASIASLFMLAAIPFRYAGTSWSLVWLLQAEALFVAGLATREGIFRKLGIVSGFGAIAQMIGTVALPIVNLRLSGSDTHPHTVEALTFACAALAAWFNAEFATRRWPHLREHDFERIMLRTMSYTAALSAGLAVWLAVPGAWTLLPWLATATMLALLSTRLRSADLAQQADLLCFAAVVRAAIVNFGQWDQFSNAPRTVILLLASALLYANMRRRQEAYFFPVEAIEPMYAWAGTGIVATLIWFAVPGAWTLLPWLGIATVLAFVSTRLRSSHFAQQADLLCLAAVLRAAVVNFGQWDQFAQTPRTVILLIASALLYANMRRSQEAYFVPKKAIEPMYAWAATGVLSVLAWYALQPAAVAVAWCLMGSVLLETGLAASKNFFRQQGFVLLAASFVRLFFINIALAPAPRMSTMIPVIALYAWVYQRLHASGPRDSFDRFAGAVNAWFATATAATLLYFSLRPEWVAAGGAGLAVGLLLLARGLRRPLFTAQAMVLVLLAAGRTLAFNVLSPDSLAANFTAGRIFTAGLPCVLLLAALPIAFSLRKLALEGTHEEREPIHAALRHPEQVLFFAPVLVLFVWIPVQLSAGMITVGWSVLGLITFLFALAARERSFRLTGLGVLLLGVGKIVTVDIWHAPPIDRYIALIVMGAALLFVSFLYSRYRETILELL